MVSEFYPEQTIYLLFFWTYVQYQRDARSMQDFAFFYLHHAEQFKVNSGPLSLAALGHSKCLFRSTQKAQASFTACFKTMPRWVNWKRDVLSSDLMSNTMPSLQLPGLADLLAYYCSHAAEMLSSHQHSVLILILISE